MRNEELGMRNGEGRINHGGHGGHGVLVRYFLLPPCSPCTPWLKFLLFLCAFVPLCEVLLQNEEWGNEEMKLSGFFGIINYSNLGTNRRGDTFDNIFKLPRHFVAVSCLAALFTNTGRHIFDHNNTTTHIGGETGKAVLYLTFTHKADHVFLLCLQSSVHLEGSGNATVSDATEFALLIRNSDDLTVYQPVNYLLRRLTGSKCFGEDIFSGKIINRHHFEALLRRYTPDCGVYLGSCLGQQFVKGICFFFGHNSHKYLLVLVSQDTESLSTPICMKNMGGLFINKIIHDFKDIATGRKNLATKRKVLRWKGNLLYWRGYPRLPNKAREQELVCITLNKTVKQRTCKSHANISLSDIVLKCRLVEKVVNEHLEVSIA